MPTYTGEFKQTVVEDLRRNRLSYQEAKRKYGITGNHSI
jgi:transposase-like protein